MSEEWKNTCFQNFRAEGGFTVSAKRENGSTAFVEAIANTIYDFIIKIDFESNNVVFESNGNPVFTKSGEY